MISTNEIWVDCVFSPEKYMVSNYGRIKAKSSNIESKNRFSAFVYNSKEYIFIQNKTTNRGYYRVALRIGGKTKLYFIHKLIALSFIPNPENKPQVNHKNGIKTDNRVENLEWVTSKENIDHAIMTGLKDCRGESHPSSQLTNELVLEIRHRYNILGQTGKQISDALGVKKSYISAIGNKKRWAHI